MFESLGDWKLEWVSSENSDEISQDFLVACGVVMGSTASLINCLGLNLQKQSLCDPANEHLQPIEQPKWIAGLSCVIVGSIIDFLSFGFAPQSLLAPLAALALIWNLGMAWYMLGEKFGKQDVYAAITIFCGTGLSVSYAPHEEVEYDLDGIIELWSKERMFYYAIVVPLLLLFHYSLVLFSENPSHALAPSFFRVQKKSNDVQSRNRLKIIGFARMAGYCGFAGIVGGQTLLFAKSIMELVKTAFKGSGAFWHIQTWFLLGMLVICLLVQVNYLNGALKHFESLYVIPIYQSYWILAGIIGGLVYFGEWDVMTKHDSRMFVLGVLITFCGLLILTNKESDASTNSASSTEKQSVLEETSRFSNDNKYTGVPTNDPEQESYRRNMA